LVNVQALEERVDPDTKVTFLINNRTHDNIAKASAELATKLTPATYHYFTRCHVHC
jgi:hypothetical protein